MANNTETFVINLKDKGVVGGLRKAGKETDNLHGKVNALNGAWSFFATAAAGFSLVHVGSEIISTLSNFERFEAVLTNTLGSGSAAQKVLEDITEFAAKTPFEVDSLTDSYVRLANQGFKPTMQEMTKLGDLASSKGKGLAQLSEALIDAEVGEFERLKEFGIRASKQGDKVAFSFKGVTKTVQFSDKAIRQYVLGLGDAEGVTGAMAAISKTTGGQISNLKDTITQLYLNLGTKLKPAISGTIQVFSQLIQTIGSFADWLYSGSTGAEIFTAAVYAIIGGLVAYKSYLMIVNTWTTIVTAAQWLWNAALTANPIGIVIVAIGALVGVIAYLANKFTGWGEAWKHTVKGAKLIFMAYVSSVKALWNGLIDGFMIGINRIKKGWYEFKNAVGLGDEAENNSIIDEINADTERRKKEIVDSIAETANLTAEALNEFKLAAGSIKKKTKEEEKKEEEDFVNSKGKGTGGGSLPKGLGTGKGKGLGAGISEVKASAPKTFNINIESLIKEQNINTTNLTESSQKVKEALTRALLTAVNDSQVIAE